MKINFKIFLLIISLLIILLFGFLWLWPFKPLSETNPLVSVTFSKYQAEQLGLDWEKTYLAILDDLKVKSIRLPVYWNEIEKERGFFSFENVDWQLREAANRGVDVILIVGYKQVRWPECFGPDWLDDLSEIDKKGSILVMLDTVVRHFRNFYNIKYWQLENEPFFPFGQCPIWRYVDKNFFDDELRLLRSLDDRPILITDSGEWGLWFSAAKRGDVFGTTLYSSAWNKHIGNFRYGLPINFYLLKTKIVKFFLEKDKIFIISELQAEPWGPKLIQDLSHDEQLKLMGLNQILKNVDFARRLGFKEIYLWGAEWWYWLKEKQKDDRIWKEMRLIM